MESRKRNLLMLWALLGIVLLVENLNVFKFSSAGIPSCIFKQYFHFDCITCGATRATDSVFRFKILEAIKLNLLYVLVFFIVSVQFIFYSINIFLYKGERKLKLIDINTKNIIILSIIGLLFMFLRNTELYHKILKI